jgi:SAM-dependent methyltransferase
LNVTNQIRKIYEDHPYPAIDRRRRGTVWCLPPRDWIESVWRPATPPRRILSAGCGTGNEAFALRKQFPNAEIVGVDFSASSLAIARRLQRAQGLRGIRFVEGDLSDPRLRKQLGGSFDFISCHGVLGLRRAPRSCPADVCRRASSRWRDLRRPQRRRALQHALA